MVRVWMEIIGFLIFLPVEWLLSKTRRYHPYDDDREDNRPQE